VVAEFAQLLKSYGLATVTGDNFSAEWPVQAFRAHGVEYRRAEKPKSAIYIEVLPLFNRGTISMPDVPRLTRELRLLERRAHRSGRDSVDHAVNGSDDYANAVCGCAWLTSQPQQQGYLALGSWDGSSVLVLNGGTDETADGWGVGNTPSTLTPADFELRKPAGR